MKQGKRSTEGVWSDTAAFMGLALAWRIAFLLAMPRVIDTADALHYIGVARQFARGDFFDYFSDILPLYPAIGALCHLFVDNWEWAMVFPSLIASVLLPGAVYFLARDMHGRATGCVAALAVALWPWLADYGLRVGPEALATLLWFLSVYCFARMLREGGLWIPAAGAAFFALHATRPEGTFLWMVAPLAAPFLCAGKGEGEARRLFPFIVLSVALLLIYASYMFFVTDVFTINPRIGNFIPGQDGATPRALIHFESDDQGIAIGEFVRAFVQLSGDVPLVMLGPIMCLFAGVGFFRTDKKRSRDMRLESFVLAFVLLHWLLVLPGHSAAPRYLMPAIVAVAIWSCRGIVLVTVQATGPQYPRWLRTLPVAALVGFMLFHTALTVGAEYIGRRPRQPREYKEAGLWMKQNLPPGLIIARKSQIGFYADMDSTGPARSDSLDEVIARAQKLNADYLVVDERYGVQMIPALKPLLEPDHAPPVLRPVYSSDAWPGARVVVYAFEWEGTASAGAQQ